MAAPPWAIYGTQNGKLLSAGMRSTNQGAGAKIGRLAHHAFSYLSVHQTVSVHTATDRVGPLRKLLTFFIHCSLH